MQLLLGSKHRLLETGQPNCNSYGDIAFITFGRFGFSVVQASLLITQTGFCCSYVIYITEMIDSMLPGTGKNMTAAAVVCCVLPMALLKHLKYLTNSSLMAN